MGLLKSFNCFVYKLEIIVLTHVQPRCGSQEGMTLRSEMSSSCAVPSCS